MKSYQQLRQEERFYIWQARREGKTQKHVAETLGRHPSGSLHMVMGTRYDVFFTKYINIIDSGNVSFKN